MYRATKLGQIINYGIMMGSSKNINTTNTLASCLIQSTATDITNPFDNIVVRIIQFRFEYFQVTNFESGWSKWAIHVVKQLPTFVNDRVALLADAVREDCYVIWPSSH